MAEERKPLAEVLSPELMKQVEDKIINFDDDDLSKVKFRYKNNNHLDQLFRVRDTTIWCGLCKATANKKNFKNHMLSVRHKSIVPSVTELVHPALQALINKESKGAMQDDQMDQEVSMVETANKPKDNVIVLDDSPIRIKLEKKGPKVKESQKSSAVKAKDKPPKDRIVVNPAALVAAAELAKQNPLKKKRKTDEAEKEKRLPKFVTKLLNEPEEDLEGYLGVEYIIKTVRGANDMEPKFVCALCEYEAYGDSMQIHIRSLNHRLKFLDKHFPTAMKRFQKYRNDPTSKGLLSKCTEKIAIAIERYHGRELPFECLASEYRQNRRKIMTKVYSFKHSGENVGPSFVNIIDEKTLDEIARSCNMPVYGEDQVSPSKKSTNPTNSSIKPIQTRVNVLNFNTFSRPQVRPTFSQPQTQPLVPQFQMQFRSPIQPMFQQQPIFVRQPSPKLENDEHARLVEQFLKQTTAGPSSSANKRNRSRSRERYRSDRKRSRHSISPRPRNYSPLRSGDKYQKYRHLVDDAIQDLKKDYRRYQKNPESHPRYDMEWKTFWNNKCDQLIIEGINPTQYDFQPEWITYFPKRMDEMLDDDIEGTKVKLRIRCDLPLSNASIPDPKYHIGKQSTVPAPENNEVSDDEVEDSMISYVEYDVPSSTDAPQMPVNVSFPTIQQPEKEQAVNVPPPPPNNISFGRNPSPELEQLKKSTREEEKQDEEYNEGMGAKEDNQLVSVLRLLTAMEPLLGLLGHRVIDLLSRAITLEKVELKASDRLLTMENCVFLETVREKLRGQLLAGVLEANQTKPVKQIIREITILVNNAMKNLKTVQSVEPEQKKSPVVQKSEKISILDLPNRFDTPEKRELARKLAIALAAQGKTDFTVEQLEQLVTVYALIEKKQRECNENTAETGEKPKSLSETLSDFLKPAGAPASDESASMQPNKNNSPVRLVTLTPQQINAQNSNVGYSGETSRLYVGSTTRPQTYTRPQIPPTRNNNNYASPSAESDPVYKTNIASQKPSSQSAILSQLSGFLSSLGGNGGANLLKNARNNNNSNNRQWTNISNESAVWRRQGNRSSNSASSSEVNNNFSDNLRNDGENVLDSNRFDLSSNGNQMHGSLNNDFNNQMQTIRSQQQELQLQQLQQQQQQQLQQQQQQQQQQPTNSWNPNFGLNNNPSNYAMQHFGMHDIDSRQQNTTQQSQASISYPSSYYRNRSAADIQTLNIERNPQHTSNNSNVSPWQPQQQQTNNNFSNQFSRRDGTGGNSNMGRRNLNRKA